MAIPAKGVRTVHCNSQRLANVTRFWKTTGLLNNPQAFHFLISVMIRNLCITNPNEQYGINRGDARILQQAFDIEKYSVDASSSTHQIAVAFKNKL